MALIIQVYGRSTSFIIKVSQFLSFQIFDLTSRLIKLSGRAFSQIGILAWLSNLLVYHPGWVSQKEKIQVMDEFRAERPTLKVHRQFRVQLQLWPRHQGFTEK